MTVEDFWMIDDESAEVEVDEADGEIDNQDDDDKAGTVAVLQKVGLNGTENGMEDDGDGDQDNETLGGGREGVLVRDESEGKTETFNKDDEVEQEK